jgi:hypothetical protein
VVVVGTDQIAVDLAVLQFGRGADVPGRKFAT